MKCPKCQFDNREGAKFCNECGHKFVLICSECGANNRVGSKFCDECGYNLEVPKETPPIDFDQPQSYTPKFLADKILTTRSSIEGERKLVTVIFADVADFTTELNPDEYVWNDLKNNCIGRKVLVSKAQLQKQVLSHLRKLQKMPALIMSFFQAPTTRYATI